MERKLRNATAKLRNLKDFLSSTRNLSQSGPSSSSSAYPHQGSRKGSGGNGLPLSVSLFDLVEPGSRPMSFANGGLSNTGGFHQNQSNSVSMYGLASQGVKQEERVAMGVPGTSSSSSRNPAVRLFNSIRSKLKKRRRDRIGGSKMVDSKSDFRPFMSNSAFASNGGIPGDTASRLDSSQSVDQLQYLATEGFEDESFTSPLGTRDRNYGKENTEPRLTSATSCFVISDNVTCHTTTSRPYDANQMDQCSPSPSSRLTSSRLLPLPPPLPAKTSGASTSCATTTISLPPASASTSTPSSPGESARLKGLAKELFDLIHYGWYWGSLSKEEAEEKLKDEEDGAFIVRDSSSNVHILSLSFNSAGKTKHTRIDYVGGKFCFLASETEAFSSVAELIEHWVSNSEQGIFCYSKSNRANGPTSYPVRLTKPISRFTEVKSLQFLSSFVLYKYTRLDLIPKLPLPPQLIDFILMLPFI